MKATPEAYKLMHEGAKALAGVEAAGIRIDTDYLDKTIDKVQRRIDGQTERLEKSETWKTWQRVYRGKANMGSRPQLGRILFDELGLKSGKKTGTGRHSTSADSLERLDDPFVKRLLEVEKLKKLRGTYLLGLRRQVVDGLLRCFYNLHLVSTYRSSSDSINFQNIPVRDKTIGKLIRRAFVPRKGRVLVEIDYASIEVRVAACYHQDPTMLKYIADGYDMHKDMAAECYALKGSQVTKDARYCAKNKFVFPQFYGSYHADCARDLWNAIRQMKLEVGVTDDQECQICGGSCQSEKCFRCGADQDRSLKDHLESKGIANRRDFEAHIKEVEDRFWNERFPVYTDWKKEWLAEYYKTGCFRMKTGFVCRGVYKRNEVINYPVQGAAFHCLLRSLIMFQKELRKRKMKSLIVGQIHDSLLLDVVKEEMEDVLALAKEVMTEWLLMDWEWIITPLEIEAESSDVNWFEKEALAV
jgi:DNA polymerase-1